MQSNNRSGGDWRVCFPHQSLKAFLVQLQWGRRRDCSSTRRILFTIYSSSFSPSPASSAPLLIHRVLGTSLFPLLSLALSIGVSVSVVGLSKSNDDSLSTTGTHKVFSFLPPPLKLNGLLRSLLQTIYDQHCVRGTSITPSDST